MQAHAKRQDWFIIFTDQFVLDAYTPVAAVHHICDSYVYSVHIERIPFVSKVYI